jgi:branched-chain amino acid aminotransferase
MILETRVYHEGDWYNPAKKAPQFDFRSRIYKYGDGFFESMKFFGGSIRHAHHHTERIRRSLMLLKMPASDISTDEIFQLIEDYIKELQWTQARIRLSYYREADGYYTPSNSRLGFFIEIKQMENEGYPLNAEGLILGNYHELVKNENYLSLLKTQSSLIYVMAGLHAQEQGWNDCVIFNQAGRVCETVSSNIFCVSGDFIHTPPLSEHCIDGVMRRVVIESAQAYGYQVSERPIAEVELMAASEIFLTNAISGIQWVGNYMGKPLHNGTAKVLSQRLN